MQGITKQHRARTSVIAVRAALAAMVIAPAAYGGEAEDALAEYTTPTNRIEVGVQGIDKSSAKFGEYNGLNKKGTYGVGNVELNGGGGDANATRWRVVGEDLGTQERSLGVEYGEQGKFRINYGYDEFKRAYSDQFKMPYAGVGGTSLSLPGWPAYSAAARPTTTTTAAGIVNNWNNIQSGTAAATLGTPAAGSPAAFVLNSMNQVDIGTERKKHDFNLGMVLSPDWQLSASARHEEKVGTKLTGVSFDSTSRGVMVPEPVSYKTNQVNAALNYAADNAHVNFGYAGSFFKNDVNLWTVASTWGNNATLNNQARMSGAPDNQMHQLNLSGAYNFSKATRLVVSGAYSRMSQNEQFISGATGNSWTVPDTSPHALVVNQTLTAKLTTKATKDLALSASYKYDNRDNRTPIQTWAAYPADKNSAAAPTAKANEPINRKTQQIALEADYSLGRGQAIKGGYDWQSINRNCDGPTCIFQIEKVKENTLRAEYRNSLSQDLTGRIGYAYSQRRSASAINENDPKGAPDPLLPGFRQFFTADRNRDKLRTSLNYQASEKLSLGAGVDYNNDNYVHSDYGTKSSRSWVLNLDAAYAATDETNFTGFYTYEDQKTRLDSLAISRYSPTQQPLTDAALGAGSYLIPHVSGGTCAAYPSWAGIVGNFGYSGVPADYFTDPCRRWSESQSDRIHTIGLGFKTVGMIGGKLDLKGDLVYSRARTPISMSGGAYYSNGLTNTPNTTTVLNNNIYIPAQSLPDIVSTTTEIRLAGKYKLNKSDDLHINYLYRQVRSSDWQYDAYTNSVLGVLAMQGYIGTAMTSPNYKVQAIGVSYVHSFK